MLNPFLDVFASLNSDGVKYLVIGGIAAIAHGVPRNTFDLDILIEATAIPRLVFQEAWVRRVEMIYQDHILIVTSRADLIDRRKPPGARSTSKTSGCSSLERDVRMQACHDAGAQSLDAGWAERVDELTRLARQLYVAGPYVMRKMMHYRIGICPFERLLPHVPPGSSVLDVGCGAGLFLALLAGSVTDIAAVGFDSSRPAIDAALQMTEQVKRLGLRADLRFLRLDVGEPWPAGLFDVVSLVDVLHHIPSASRKSLFEKATKSVKPGGVLLYKDMANHPVFHAGMNRLHDLLLARQWIHYLPISRIDEWAGEFGLAISHAEAMSRLWYRHELRVYRKPPNRS